MPLPTTLTYGMKMLNFTEVPTNPESDPVVLTKMELASVIDRLEARYKFRQQNAPYASQMTKAVFDEAVQDIVAAANAASGFLVFQN